VRFCGELDLSLRSRYTCLDWEGGNTEAANFVPSDGKSVAFLVRSGPPPGGFHLEEYSVRKKEEENGAEGNHGTDRA